MSLGEIIMPSVLGMLPPKFIQGMMMYMWERHHLGVIEHFARQYSVGLPSGEQVGKLELVLDEAEALMKKGYSITFDSLGEKSKTLLDIVGKEKINLDLLDMANERDMFEPTKRAIAENKPYPYVFSPTFSIKPSSFLFHGDNDKPINDLGRFEEFLQKFAMRALNYGAGITIDMEEPYIVEQTVKCYLKYAFNMNNGTEIFDTRIPVFDNLGIVHQTSLDRTSNDISNYAVFGNSARVRLCIGIYDITKKDIWADGDLSSGRTPIGTMNMKERKRRLVDYAKYLAERNVYVEVATHDVEVIKELLKWFTERGISKDMYEFQALYHVRPEGLEEVHRQLIDDGTRVRIYLPFAPTLNDAAFYGIRRSSKNSQLLWTFTKEAVKYYCGFTKKGA